MAIINIISFQLNGVKVPSSTSVIRFLTVTDLTSAASPLTTDFIKAETNGRFVSFMINSLSETVIYTFLSDDSEKRLKKKMFMM